MDKKTYNEKVKETAPKTDELRTLIPAFLVGGLICSIGEGFKDLYAYLFPVLKEAEVGSAVSATMIFLGALITIVRYLLVGLYDKIGRVAGGGSIIPITGFANSIVSPAMEYNREGVFYGVCAKMFTIAGPIIVFGITASVVVGIVGLFL